MAADGLTSCITLPKIALTTRTRGGGNKLEDCMGQTGNVELRTCNSELRITRVHFNAPDL
jgi:hypothetical protein